MDTAILNRKSSLVSHWADKRMLWACSLFSGKVYFMVPDLLLEDVGFIRKLDKKKQLLLLKKMSPLLVPDYTEEKFETELREYNYFQSLKQKNRDIILQIMTRKRKFGFFEGQYFKAMNGMIRDSGIEPLYQLNKTPGAKFIVFRSSIASLPEITDMDFALKTALKIILTDNVLFVLDASAKNTSAYKEGFSPRQYDGSLIIAEEELFSIPSPEALNTEQIKSVRNLLVPEFNSLFVPFSFTDNQTILMDHPDKEPESIPAGSNAVGSIAAESILSENILSEKIRAVISKSACIRKLLETNPALTCLMSSEDNDKKYKIHLGICSLRSLLEIYTELKILTEEILNNVMETLNGKIAYDGLFPVLIIDT